MGTRSPRFLLNPKNEIHLVFTLILAPFDGGSLRVILNNLRYVNNVGIIKIVNGLIFLEILIVPAVIISKDYHDFVLI